MPGKFDYWQSFPKSVLNPFGDCTADGIQKTGAIEYAYSQPASLDFLNQDWGTFGIVPTPLAGTTKYVSPTLIKYSATYVWSVLEEFPDNTAPEMLFPKKWYELARAELHNWLGSWYADNLQTIPYPKLVNWTTNVAWLCTSMLLATNLYPLFWSDMVRMAQGTLPGFDKNPWDPTQSQYGSKTQVVPPYNSGKPSTLLTFKADGVNAGCTISDQPYLVMLQNPLLHPFDQLSDNLSNLGSYGNGCWFAPGDQVASSPFFKKDQFWVGPQSGIHPHVLWQNVDSTIKGPMVGDTSKIAKFSTVNGKPVQDVRHFFSHFPWAGLYSAASLGAASTASFANAQKVDPHNAMGLKMLLLRASLFGGLQAVFNLGCTSTTTVYAYGTNKPIEIEMNLSPCFVNSDRRMRGSAEKWKTIGEVLSQVPYETMVRTGVNAWQIRNAGTVYQLNTVAPPITALAREDMLVAVHAWEKQQEKARRMLGISAAVKFIQGMIRLFTRFDFYGYIKAVQASTKLGQRAMDFMVTNVPWDWSRDIDPLFIRIYKSVARVNPLDNQKGTLTKAQKQELVEQNKAMGEDPNAESATAAWWIKLPDVMTTLENHVKQNIWTVPAAPIVAAPKPTTYQVPTQKSPGSTATTVSLWLLATAALGSVGYLAFRPFRRRRS